MTFSYDGTYTNYSASAGGGTSGSYSGTFTYYTGTEWYTLKEGEEITLTSNFYYYMGSDAMGESSSNAYNMLFNLNDYYWLASPMVIGYSGFADFGCFGVYEYGSNYDVVYGGGLFGSNGEDFHGGLSVRPVVSLESGITLEDDGNDGWNIK